ncbi:uncharacterized protein EI97DRAFT_497370 [Westerdykella ornata]|uniref:Tyr recombinase domain-containing protein n=1 Tax=Westerdykella ornata TaxID=318751 RepID=A0A6A6J459_WESOR|nr:uncharacterized protein EI97DRAFT_497370 [Westerdykella ornata]KAF2271225.1 hypothetical protein EI97DRAFT_497370 [Westerdykella ornata]
MGNEHDNFSSSDGDDDLIALAREIHPCARPPTDEELQNRLNPDHYKRYEHVSKLWKTFCAKILQWDEDKCFSSILSVPQIQIFLRWIARYAKGTIDQRITDVTLMHRFNTLKIRDHKDITNFIKRDLVHEKRISTKVRQKPIAPFAVAEDLVTFLWKADEYDFLHSRARLQLAFLIVILALSGCRLGEIIESSTYAGSNESLYYKDFELGWKSMKAYTGYFVLLQLRVRKGIRNHEKHA